MIRALFVSLALASPSVANERAMQMLNDWIAMVERHAAGERDQALADLGAWTGDELELMRTYVQALAGVPTNDQERANRRRSINGVEMAAIKTRIMDLEALGRFDEFRKRAALLHTDAALFEFAPVVVDAPVARNLKPRRDEAEPAIDVKTVDGRVERYEVANPHWQFALDLLESLPAQPQRDPLVAQWYRAIGAYFAEQDNSADAMRLFERARRIVPDHPDVLFGEACLQETLGGPDVQNFARTATLPNGLTLRGVTSRRHTSSEPKRC
jgi:tetratricopeptide (TPR) repeat protein